jgi:hypothetical protein
LVTACVFVFFYKQTLNLARHSVIERKKMSYSTSSEEDERDQVIMPNAIVAQAKEAIEKMVPPKSRLLLYEKEYKLCIL